MLLILFESIRDRKLCESSILQIFFPGRFLNWRQRYIKMNKKLIKIASDLKNFHAIDNYTHTHKLKSKLCGDEIHVYLIVKKKKLVNFKYETKSCIYCQASASLLSRVAINKKTEKLKILYQSLNKSFIKKSSLKKNWNKFLVIINKSNVSRKDCLMLPLRAALKALKNSC